MRRGGDNRRAAALQDSQQSRGAPVVVEVVPVGPAPHPRIDDLHPGPGVGKDIAPVAVHAVRSRDPSQVAALFGDQVQHPDLPLGIDAHQVQRGLAGFLDPVLGFGLVIVGFFCVAGEGRWWLVAWRALGAGGENGQGHRGGQQSGEGAIHAFPLLMAGVVVGGVR